MSSHARTESMGSPLTSLSRTPYMIDEGSSYSPYAVNEETKAPSRPGPQYLQSRGMYLSVSWILGFKENYSLLNCFIWGGALVGFCLARSMAMNPRRISNMMPAGEWFWLNRPVYRPSLFIHIYLSTFGGIGALLQFLPVIRRRKIILHRLNGYGVLLCLIVGNVCGAIVARRSFGGELNAQSGYYVMGLMIVVSGIMGIVNVKRDTRRHRKWMMRMVVYFGAAITARLATLAAASIITIIGTYYTVWSCDQVVSLLGDSQTSFPECAAPGVNTADVWVAVHASNREGALHTASALRAVHGMGLWVSLLIHVVAAEFYINMTEASNKVRIEYALEPIDFAEDETKNY